MHNRIRERQVPLRAAEAPVAQEPLHGGHGVPERTVEGKSADSIPPGGFSGIKRMITSTKRTKGGT
jgi:hypothetical protein